MDKQATSIPSTLSTTSTTNKTNENDELVASIAFALKSKIERKLNEMWDENNFFLFQIALQLQTRKVLKYQEVSYEWHLQVNSFKNYFEYFFFSQLSTFNFSFLFSKINNSIMKI